MYFIIALTLITVMVVMDHACGEQEEMKTIQIKKNCTMF